MALYSPPKVDVNVVLNPRIINIAQDVTLPAFVALGPTTRSVLDEAVSRGVGSYDTVATYPAPGFTLSKVTKRSGLNYTSGSTSNDIDAIPGINGSLYLSSGSIPAGGIYPVAGYTADALGKLTWPQDPTAVATGSVPASGSLYYVSYTYNVPATQFLPQTFSDKDDIAAVYGAENISTGLLTIAGSLALENGAPAVILTQVSGSVYSEANYRTAIDALKKKNNVEEIVLLFPSGSVTPTQRNSIYTYLFQHVQLMNLASKWRGMIVGPPSPYWNPSMPNGVEYVIGDSSNPYSYAGQATMFAHEDVVVVAPGVVQRYDTSGNLYYLSGEFVAAAVAGVHSAQPLKSTPITGFVVTGLVIENDKWDDYQYVQLGTNGVCSLQSVGGVVTIKDALTTDTTSAETVEINVVSQRRLVQRTLSNLLFQTYTNKGKVITPTTPRDVEATVRSILNSLRNSGEIYGYGVKDDPATGEVKISAIQDPLEPRKINVTCSVKFLFPLKYITVTVSTFV